MYTPARRFVCVTMADNPNLPARFVEAQKRLYSGFFYKRFIDGLWVMAEGANMSVYSSAVGSPLNVSMSGTGQ